MGTNKNGGFAPRHRRVDPWLLAAALLGLIPLLSLLRPGVAGTADGIVHLLRTLQVTELFKAGAFYPQWAPDFYFGYGYPFFLFYTPGVHIVTGFLALAGLGVPNALVTTQALAILLYGAGTYLAASRIFDGLASPSVVSMAALAAAALYVFTPLRMRELFSQGNLSQLVALSLLPWCLWALLPVARAASLRWTAVAALLLAALLYAHHPTAFLSFPILLALGLTAALLRRKGRQQAIASLFASFTLALALSAAFWLPWVLESGYGSLQRMETGFNAASNLVPADQLFSPSLPLDASSINSPRPLTIGLAQAVLAALGALAAILLARRASEPAVRRNAALLPVSAGLFLLCVLLMLPLAAALWTNLPLAKFIAFPWRLLGPAGLLAAILGGAPLLLLGRRPAFIALLAVLLVAPLSVAPYLFPLPSLWRPLPPEGLTLADIGRYEVAGGSRGTASANEYLPRWVDVPDPPLDLLAAYEAGDPPERLNTAALPAGATYRTLQLGSLQTVHRLNLPLASPVTIRRFYYPGWQAFVDGERVEVHPAPPYGLIEIDMPAGDHELRVMWGQTVPRQAGLLLAGVGLAVTLGLAILGGKKVEASGRFSSLEPTHSRDLLWLAATAFVLLVAATKVLWIEPHTSWFRLASPLDAPSGMTHALGIRFDNGIELLGYDLPRAEARQGGELKLRLFWRTNGPLDQDLRSFAHLDAPVTAITWANQTKDHIGEMPVSKWPPGFYVVDDFRIHVPTGTPPVAAELTVGLLTRAGAPIPLPDGREKLRLKTVPIQPGWRPFEQSPSRKHAYRLGEAIVLEGYRAQLATDESGANVVDLALYWQAGGGVGTDYTVFAQVFEATGDMAGQLDGPPCSGSCPTSRWTPGGVIEDRRRIPLARGVSMEGLKVRVGMYDAASGQRLPVVDTNSVEMIDDAIQIEVASPENGNATR